MKEIQFHILNEHSFLIRLDKIIDPEVHRRLLMIDHYLKITFAEEILETVPSYQELAVYLHQNVNLEEFIQPLKKPLKDLPENIKEEKGEIIKVPVCYEGDFAPDLKIVAEKNGLSPQKVIKLHTQPIYTVYFLGFLPGFPYLGGLNPQLKTSRKSSPRPRINEGSVGIANDQTGIYTVPSPGGWQIIGRSPLEFFNPHKDQPTLIKAGNRIQFFPIDQNEFENY